MSIFTSEQLKRIQEVKCVYLDGTLYFAEGDVAKIFSPSYADRVKLFKDSKKRAYRFKNVATIVSAYETYQAVLSNTGFSLKFRKSVVTELGNKGFEEQKRVTQLGESHYRIQQPIFISNKLIEASITVIKHKDEVYLSIIDILDQFVSSASFSYYVKTICPKAKNFLIESKGCTKVSQFVKVSEVLAVFDKLPKSHLKNQKRERYREWLVEEINHFKKQAPTTTVVEETSIATPEKVNSETVIKKEMPASNFNLDNVKDRFVNDLQDLIRPFSKQFTFIRDFKLGDYKYDCLVVETGTICESAVAQPIMIFDCTNFEEEEKFNQEHYNKKLENLKQHSCFDASYIKVSACKDFMKDLGLLLKELI